MSDRTRGGFRPIGRVDVETLGLPLSKARQLLLEHGWSRVAGEAIARRARAVAIRRGVLEIAVDDPRWASELRALLPRLAGRLARRFPDLGVKRFRINVAGAPDTRLPADLPKTEEPVEASSWVTPPTYVPEAGVAGITTGRLVEVAQRYLERSEQRGSSKPDPQGEE